MAGCLFYYAIGSSEHHVVELGMLETLTCLP